MNLRRQSNTNPPTNLLVTIKTIHADVGESLNDDELTHLLRESTLPAEEGFTFLSFSNGYVMLSVPHQDPADWYPPQGWIAPDKERVANTIAETYELELYEPIDAISSFQNHHAGSAIVHHHFEFTDGRQTVITAHPLYLKVRLFGKSPEHRYAWEALSPLPLGPDLLHDISRLYEKQNKHKKPEPDDPAHSGKNASLHADEIPWAPGSLPRDLDDWLQTERLTEKARPIGSNEQPGATGSAVQRFP
ncbi:MAG: hypothetical protein ABSE16_03950 [Verrucomicrobiota bacterium]